jgi:hypothetical protein
MDDSIEQAANGTVAVVEPHAMPMHRLFDEYELLESEIKGLEEKRTRLAALRAELLKRLGVAPPQEPADRATTPWFSRSQLVNRGDLVQVVTALGNPTIQEVASAAGIRYQEAAVKLKRLRAAKRLRAESVGRGSIRYTVV